ncbi:hypothetical protein ElyMa_005644400 [Elysia marginata]|uniref:Uncharacterized protein n=1 Tax=Elysia marginata TaxID=1093978 RepID=A0AAV4FCD2_9GAST|nr:hypothetical protein ElyMa_005644400 [Elysia marginata]
MGLPEHNGADRKRPRGKAIVLYIVLTSTIFAIISPTGIVSNTINRFMAIVIIMIISIITSTKTNIVVILLTNVKVVSDDLYPVRAEDNGPYPDRCSKILRLHCMFRGQFLGDKSHGQHEPSIVRSLATDHCPVIITMSSGLGTRHLDK